MVLEERSGGQTSAGEERPSLFSDSGNRLPLFNPFAAALVSLDPEERCESHEWNGFELLRLIRKEFLHFQDLKS